MTIYQFEQLKNSVKQVESLHEKLKTIAEESGGFSLQFDGIDTNTIPFSNGYGRIKNILVDLIHEEINQKHKEIKDIINE